MHMQTHMHVCTHTHTPPSILTPATLILSHPQVRKELEVHGIEFYPQKEFDEDLEDKTENDKIRVSAWGSVHTEAPLAPAVGVHVLLLAPHLLSLLHSLPHPA